MNLLKDAPITTGTKVFVRCDLDVPIENGQILEKYRLEACLDTLKFIIQKGGFPLVAGHIGKPEGKVLPALSTQPLKPFFIENLGEGTFELLENLRFNPGEEANSQEYSQQLASQAQIYINESFATCHREHASIIGVPKILPHFAGLRLQKEVENLSHLLKTPIRPFIVIVGGAKLESKLPVITRFLKAADRVVYGGKLTGSWEGEVPANLVLPLGSIDGKDIDSQTIEKYKEIIQVAKTILWAGPLGVYEEEKYINGTREIALKIAEVTKNNNAISIIGGGDTIAASQRIGVLQDFTFVSTGGSAMLQFLANGTLPGLEALN